MGNAYSTAYDADDRIHICNRCGWFWHKDKSRVRMHQAFGCKRDARYKGGNSTVSISGRTHHQHHRHSACDACEHDAAHDADEQLREAVDAQLEHFIQTTGAELSEDAVAGLSDMLVGILGNEARDEVDDAMDDYLEELRDLLGVPTDPEYYQNQHADDQAPDPESRQELQRLLQHLHDPVTPGAPYTVLQTVIIELAIKRRNRITDTAFDELCKWHHASRPQSEDNYYPRSLWLMKKVAGVEDVRKIQVHMCVNDCKKFAFLRPDQYLTNADEVCEHCKQRRFEVKFVGDTHRIVPRKVMYWFGLGPVIRDRLFTDPAFCKHRTTGRDEYYYRSLEACRLSEASACDIWDWAVSCYEVGLDWAQMFTSKVHSTGFIMFRCADMPLSQLNRRRFCHVVGIIPGPKEPVNIDPYLEDLLQDFNNYGPAGPGLTVTPYKLGADNRVQQEQPFQHTILLSGVFGDSPAIKKLAHWLSHAAYLGCGYCTSRGTVGEDGKGMYQLGYTEPNSYGTFRPKEVEDYGAHSEHADGVAMCGDEAVMLSHQDQLDRAAAVDQGRMLPTEVGSHGTSPFVAKLGCVDYNNLFVVPVAHAGLLGVVKDFWSHLLTAEQKKKKKRGRDDSSEWFRISAEARRVMASREAALVATCDFGRSYTDIISKKGNWVMEDWLHWAECWSVFVLRPYQVDGQERQVLHPKAAEMWQHLRAGLLYFCRSNPIGGVAQNVDDALKELKAYARLVQKRFGVRMCKFNLHVLVCRLAKQEADRGRAAHSTEYWLENLIQWAKSTVRYRTTKYPELVLAHDIMLDDAIARCTAQHECVREKLYEWEHVDGLGMTLRHPDDGAADGTQLLGRGQVLSDAECVAIGADQAVRTFVADFQPPGWSSSLVDRSEMILYTYAQAAGSELLHSTRYTRARSRVSYNVWCRFWEGELGEVVSGEESEVPTNYIGKVSYFVKVVPPRQSSVDGEIEAASAPAEVLRLAVLDLHLLQEVDAGVGPAYQSVTYCTGDAAHTNTAMSLSLDDHSVGNLCCKMALAKENDVAFFLPYSNMSASGSDD